LKKTNTFTNIAMFVLFAAMLVYLGVYLFRSTQQSYATAPAVLVTVSESGQASGIVVREEQVIASDKEFLSLSVDDGKEVASGGEIAIGVDSKAALDSASRARELKKEIAYVSSLLSRAGSASGASDRDSDVRSAILQLNAAVSAGSTSELDDLCMDLSSLLFGSATGTVSQGDLDALNAELHQLENAGAGRGSITAPACSRPRPTDTNRSRRTCSKTSRPTAWTRSSARPLPRPPTRSASSSRRKSGTSPPS